MKQNAATVALAIRECKRNTHHQTTITTLQMETILPQTKRCSHCGAVKPASEFYRCTSNAENLQGTCKACSKASSKAYYRLRRAKERRLRDSKCRLEDARQTFEDELDAASAERLGVVMQRSDVPLNPDLQAFTPRQLMRELYARGYEGSLTYSEQVVHRINIAACKR